MLQLVIGRLSKSIPTYSTLKMNSFTFWFLLLVCCEKCVTEHSSLPRNWYTWPMLWPVDPAAARIPVFAPLTTRYGRYIPSAVVANSPHSFLNAKYRLSQNHLNNYILKNINLQTNKKHETDNMKLREASKPVDFRPVVPQFLPTRSTAAFEEIKNQPQVQTLKNLSSSHRNKKYCRRDPSHMRNQFKVQPKTTKATLLPNVAFTENEFNAINLRDQRTRKPITQFKPQTFQTDDSHSFFTLNDAVTSPSMRHSYQDFGQAQLKFFTPTILPTIESKLRPDQYKETFEPSESNVNTQKLLPFSTEESIRVALTTNHVELATTENTLRDLTTISINEATTTAQSLLEETSTKGIANSTLIEKNNRYSKQARKTYSKETIRKSEKHRLLPPLLKLKSKQEFFTQARLGRVKASTTPQPATESSAQDNTESVTNFTTNLPSTTKAKRTRAKSMRPLRSTVATQIERTSRKPNRGVVPKQRSLKRFFRKSVTKNEENKPEVLMSSTMPLPTSDFIHVSSKRAEIDKKERKANEIKSTQSTIMKIYGNKNNGETVKTGKSSRRQTKEMYENTNIQPLPIEIFFQKQQTSLF